MGLKNDSTIYCLLETNFRFKAIIVQKNKDGEEISFKQ